MNRKLRMAMIGGGKDAFIGAVHRIALNMDGQVEMVAGALSAVPAVAIESGKMLFLDEDRIYTDYKIMLEKEAAMPADKRIDFVSSVTPNFEALVADLHDAAHDDILDEGRIDTRTLNKCAESMRCKIDRVVSLEAPIAAT